VLLQTQLQQSIIYSELGLLVHERRWRPVSRGLEKIAALEDEFKLLVCRGND
jgi:hypothetical protein